MKVFMESVPDLRSFFLPTITSSSWGASFHHSAEPIMICPLNCTEIGLFACIIFSSSFLWSRAERKKYAGSHQETHTGWETRSLVRDLSNPCHQGPPCSRLS